MNKPNCLRAHLLATVPALEHNPDRLLVFIDDGAVHCRSSQTFSWEYSYTLQVILTDFAGHPDTVMLPLLGWISVHQSELLANHEKYSEGIVFEADIIDADKVDLGIKLKLTERVIIGKDGQGETTITHPPEPLPALAYIDPDWKAAALGVASEWFIPGE